MNPDRSEVHDRSAPTIEERSSTLVNAELFGDSLREEDL